MHSGVGDLLIDNMNLSSDYSLLEMRTSGKHMRIISLLIDFNAKPNLHFIFLIAFHTYSMLKSIYKDDVRLQSFFGWRIGYKMRNTSNKIDAFFDTIMLKPIEYVFFQNMVRQHALLKFEKGFEDLRREDVSEMHWGVIKKTKSHFRRLTIPSDVHKLNIFIALDISVSDYFNKLNQHLFGQMYSMYQFRKAYLKDSLLGVFLDTVESDLSDSTLRSIVINDYKKYDVMQDKIAEVMKKWKKNE